MHPLLCLFYVILLLLETPTIDFSAETIIKILNIIFKTIQTIQTVSVDRRNCSIKCLHTLYPVWSVLFVDHQHLFQWLFQTTVSNICMPLYSVYLYYIGIILVLKVNFEFQIFQNS
jgi:hypothetical protein